MKLTISNDLEMQRRVIWIGLEQNEIAVRNRLDAVCTNVKAVALNPRGSRQAPLRLHD
jgi:hypothetical protein